MSNILDTKSSIDKILFSTSCQKISKFLTDFPSGEYTEKDIQKATQVSKSGVNSSLKSLVCDGMIRLQKKGRMSFYTINPDDPLIRQIKVLNNLIKINSLVTSTSDLCEKIVLFGSAATGTNIEESDIDLFILTNNPKVVTAQINKSSISEKLQLVLKKPVGFAALKKSEPVFYDEISRGLVLWEKK